VGSRSIGRAAELALNRAFVEVSGRLLRKQVDQGRRTKLRRMVEIRCECDEQCGTMIRVHRRIYSQRDLLRQEWFLATGHTRAAGNHVVHTESGYQLVEAHPRKFVWAKDPWS
jgi:hypothetical protein